MREGTLLAFTALQPLLPRRFADILAFVALLPLPKNCVYRLIALAALLPLLTSWPFADIPSLQLLIPGLLNQFRLIECFGT